MEFLQQPNQTPHIKNVLKPWTKELLTKCWDWCSPMLDGESLMQLYKCMGSYCSFTTNDTEAMILHLQNHDDNVDTLRCAYCVLTFNQIADMIAHIKIEHGQCRYQCSYCFYRALDAANVLHHQKIYHTEERCVIKSIIELPLHHEIVGAELLNGAMRGKVRQKLLKCTVCNQHFLAISSYIQHIKTVHDGTTVSCCWCHKKIMKDNAAAHLLSHYIGTYECLYCDYACNIKQMMQRHLGNVHAAKPMFCSKRREAKDLHPPKKNYLLDLRGIVPAECVKSLDCVMQTGKDNAIKSKTSPIEKEAGDEQLQIPKILNIQGGIQLTNNGTVLNAQQTLPNAQLNRKFSFTREEVSIVPASKVIVREATDSKPVRTFKRTRLDPAMQKLSKNFSITLTKSPNKVQPTVTPQSTFGHFEVTKQYSGQPKIIENNSTSSYNAKHKTGLITPTKRSSVETTECRPNHTELVKHTMTYSEHAKSSTNLKRNSVGEVSYKVKEISFRLTEYKGDLDKYYQYLSICMNNTKITSKDINACGIGSCTLRYETQNALFQHMKSSHGLLSVEHPITITCPHCALQLNNLSNYLYHLSVHSLNQYACFLCCYRHFLLTNVVTHMSESHSCTSVQLSYAHPAKTEILSDIIIVMPGVIGVEEKLKYIQKTIELGEHRTRNENSMNKPLLRPVRTYEQRTVKNYTVQPHFSLLYKCGLCNVTETSKLSFQKHLLQECPNNKRSHYLCAHCNKMFKDWYKNPETIFEHLYFHGENLYACGACAYYHYLFENVAMHIKGAFHSPKCEIKVLRESADQWECNVCQLKSSFRQTVMEHMQNVHDLPGERFMCSLCNARMLTKEKSIKHFKENHPNQDVVMIEMYHEAEIENSSNNGETDSTVDTDDSSDLQIIDDVIESFSISSASDNGDDCEDILSDLENDLDDPTGKKLRRKCPIFREHNYFRMECSEYPLITKVKIENDLKTAEITQEQVVGENVSPEGDQPRIAGTAAGTDNGSSTAMEESNEALTDTATVQQKDDTTVATDSEIQQSLSPSTVMCGLSMERRASRRVAVKKDVTSRWIHCTKYGCIFCDNSFDHYKSLHMHSRIVHGAVSRNFLCDPNTERSNQVAGSFTGFRLFSIARCFYCDKEDTYAALRMHHDKKHEGKTFICLDYWNAMKCGLCAYLNGTGNEKEFSHHFQQFHTTISKEYISPYDHIDDNFIQWALTLGSKLSVQTTDELKIIKYICGTCPEKCEDELSMGMHVASHVIKFNCDYCTKSFKQLRVLYEHALMIHRVEDFDPPAAGGMVAEQMLLDVKMCFINGFILSKREAQFTSHGSLQRLEDGYQKYNECQLTELDSYKTMLSMPISTSSMVETSLKTCKYFLQNQTTHPTVMLLPVNVQASAEES